MLDSYENRKGYMLAFGLVANTIISVILGENKEIIGELAAGRIAVALKSYPFLSSKPSSRSLCLFKRIRDQFSDQRLRIEWHRSRFPCDGCEYC